MARSLDQILKEIAALETATAKVDHDLQTLYQRYLEVLGNAVRQQLVQAGYHLCTQVYPESFLALSVSQREKVQAGLRNLGTQGRSQIQNMPLQAELLALPSVLLAPDMLGRLKRMGLPQELLGQVAEAVTEDAPASEAEPGGEAEEPSLGVDRPPDAAPPDAAPPDTAPPEPAPEPSPDPAPLTTDAVSPLALAKRHVLLERQIRAVLQSLSNMANLMLKQAQILPDLPEIVLAAATESEAGEVGPSVPNVLNVLVEMGRDRQNEADDSDDDSEDEDDDGSDDDDDMDEFDDEETDFDDEDDMVALPDAGITQLVAVSLRLADIEFMDTRSALWRSRIREVLGRLRKLGTQYQKLQREKARAEAESAWRASWYDES